MKCEWFSLPDGTRGVVCGGRRRTPRCQMPGCTRPGERQCDFPVGPGKTCDRYLCAGHAVRQGKNRDFCPDHPGQLNLAL
jgi:hypothetical protein